MNRTSARAVVFALLLASVAAACSAGGSDGVASGGAGGGDGATAQSRRVGGGGAEGAADEAAVARPAPGARGAIGLPSVDPSVVKTADVKVAVPGEELQDVLRETAGIAARHNGFVVSKTVDDSGERSGIVVMRVPAEEFERALQELQDAGNTLREDVMGEDVSEEFVDLEARLRNWRTQEVVLLRLMDRAETVVGTIRVQSELSAVQLEIERIRGRLRFLENQASFGTISATYVVAGAPGPGDGRPGMIARAWREAIEVMLSFVSALIVSLGFLIPAAVLGLIGLAIYRNLRPRPAAH